MSKKSLALVGGILTAGLLYWGGPQVANALSAESDAAKSETTCPASECPLDKKQSVDT